MKRTFLECFQRFPPTNLLRRTASPLLGFLKPGYSLSPHSGALQILQRELLQCLRTSFFSLIEVVIAMAMTMVLFVILMGFYAHLERANVALEKEQVVNFKKLYLSTRLSMILPRALGGNEGNKDFIFYTSYGQDSMTKAGSPVLMFTFNNGVKLDPAFSNNTLGRLYIDNKNQLCLSIWPAPSRWEELSIPPMKTEVLFENVESLSFSFYVPPTRERQIILKNNQLKFKPSEALQADPMGEWKDEWQQEYGDLPALIKVHLKTTLEKEEQQFSFTYPLPLSRLIILY